ncbi:MAG: DUF6311 domain-containing protein [Synergistaceae bacterium]|nr:DUF6311 domain-containing protein [Synergistaceae bacterium]
MKNGVFGLNGYSKSFVFIFSGLLGAVFFIFVYGAKVLDFTYTDWLMMGGDPTQYYLGWEFFRNSNWSFPVGLVDSFVHPYKESIMFSDSIPLFAIPFKALSSLLPDKFQYFGLFGILTYILQGAFGGLILKKLTGNTVFSIVGSLFFTMASFLTWRMFGHTSLSAHFIILASIYVCITKDANRSSGKNILIWSGLLGISVTIHLYLTVMVFVFMAAYWIDNIFEHKSLMKIYAELCIPIAISLIIMYLIGAFYSEAPKGTPEPLGFYGTNINSIVNPGGMSKFLKDLPLATGGQYEGNAYIGYGMILSMFIALFIFAWDIRFYALKFTDKKTGRRTFLGILIFITFYIIALSPVIALNDGILFTYGVSGFDWKILNIFRASGRFIWPAVYMIMITTIFMISKLNKYASTALLSILAFVQFQDMANYFNAKGAYFRQEQKWETNLKSGMWSIIAKDYKHLFYDGSVENLHGNVLSVAKFAVENKITVNDFHLARKDWRAIEAYKRSTLDRLSNGRAENDTVYFFSGLPEPSTFRDLFFYQFDGMTAGFSKQIENAEHMQGVTLIEK